MHDHLSPYTAAFNLTENYNWSNIASINDIVKFWPDCEEKAFYKGEEALLLKCQGLEITAKKALAEIKNAHNLADQKAIMLKVFFLCTNILHIKHMFPKHASIMQLQDIYAEARLLPLFNLIDIKHGVKLYALKAKLEAFLQKAPQPLEMIEFIPQREHQYDLDFQMKISLRYFNSLQKFISSTSSITENFISLFEAIAQSGIFRHLLTTDEKVSMINTYEFNFELIETIDHEISKINATYIDFAICMQRQLAFQLEKLFKSYMPAAYLMGEQYADYKDYCKQPLSEQEKYKFHAFFKNLKMPLTISDASGLHHNVYLDNLEALGCYFNHSSQVAESILKVAHLFRKRQKTQRETRTSFINALSSFKHMPPPLICLVDFDWTKLYQWNTLENTQIITTFFQPPCDDTHYHSLNAIYEKEIEHSLGMILKDMRQALNALSFAKDSEEQTTSMQKACMIYENMRQLKNFVPPRVNSDAFIVALEEVRTWPIHYFNHQDFNGYFQGQLAYLKKLKHKHSQTYSFVTETVNLDSYKKAASSYLQSQCEILLKIQLLIPNVIRYYHLLNAWLLTAKSLNLNKMQFTSLEYQNIKTNKNMCYMQLAKMQKIWNTFIQELTQSFSNSFHLLNAEADSLFKGHNVASYILEIGRAIPNTYTASERQECYAVQQQAEQLPFPLIMPDPLKIYGSVLLDSSQQLVSLFSLYETYFSKANERLGACKLLQTNFKLLTPEPKNKVEQYS